MIYNIIISLFGIGTAIYLIPYGVSEYKQNKLGSVIIYLMALTSAFFSIYQNFT